MKEHARPKEPKQFQFLDWFAPVFTEDKTYWVISGGRASGKSTQAAAYFLMQLLGKQYFRGVVARYTQKSISSSIYRDILDLVDQWGVGPYLSIKGDEIKAVGTKNMITTHAMRLQEGTQTSKGKGLARVTHLLIDEATELPAEEEYIKLIDSFRQKAADRKILLLFNPESKSHWIFKRWFLPDGSPNPKWTENHGFIHTTYLDNKQNLNGGKMAEWEASKLTDPLYYAHHILGHWTDIGEGQIFKDWNWKWEAPDPEAEINYGLDFGWVDPCVLVKTYKKGKRLWAETLVYQSGITTEDLYHIMVKAGVDKRASIYADAADPSSIETLRRMGFTNIKKAYKGPDSIRAGIDKLKTFSITANPASEPFVEEYYQYSYKPGQDQPIDGYNHCMDSLRYALSHDRVGQGRYAVASGRARPEVW
jgi:phage terminase large subunit